MRRLDRNCDKLYKYTVCAARPVIARYARTKSNAAALLRAWRSGFARRAMRASRWRQNPNRAQSMKCYPAKLWLDGKRLQRDQCERPARLVTLTLSSSRGFRQLKAECCFGGSVVGYLWEPAISNFGEVDLTEKPKIAQLQCRSN